MGFHIAARFHAFANGLFRPSEERKTWFLYHRVQFLLEREALEDTMGRAGLALMLAGDLADTFGLSEEHAHRNKLAELVAQVIDYEDLFVLPHIDWGTSYTVAEHFDLRALLRTQLDLMKDFKSTYQAMQDALAVSLNSLYSVPFRNPDRTGAGVQTFEADMLSSTPHCGAVVEGMVLPFFDEGLADRNLFRRLRHRFDHNLEQAGGKSPDASTIKDPHKLAQAYLAGTPFLPFLDDKVAIVVAQETRFEHTHVLGGTGHGKTQLLQYMLLRDIESAAQEKLSLVVVDSQGDLIRKLSNLKQFSGPLAERLIIIDPADIEHPPALNLFDAGLDRLESYTPHQRELAFNSLVDIYGRFFGSLLGAELTAKQGAVFRYLARLMLTVNGATIHTLIELMDNPAPFKKYIQQLDPTAKRFFEQEFSRGGFSSTRQQIKQRLYTVLSIPTFDRLFSAPKSKINFFDALNDGTIILVNTAKDLLKADGAAIFGRFVLSLIEHAIMERATLKENERTPTFLYVDEAQDYFDETIETLLVQGRKQHFGLIMAHQNLAQTSTRLNAVLAANTTIKFAGGISDKDARALASDMRTSVDMLLSMRKRADQTEFALSVRNQRPHALKIDIPIGFLEQQGAMSTEDYEALMEWNRERVCYVLEAVLPEPEPKSVQETISEAERIPGAPVSPDVAQEAQVAGHRAIQEKIAKKAKKHGFTASVEYLLPNDKRIDVVLFGHGLRIAIEVSVTNRAPYELSNIEKALEAGFTTVWMVAPDAEHQKKLEAFVRDKLAVEQWARVLFGTEGDIATWLGRYEALRRNAASVAGYAVEIAFIPPQAVQEQQYRREQLRHALRSC
ncbi:type IV secretory system conjugative DNA transfer family protein [Kordiimonas sp.]|uniref:type IV secretory system conjugative DNA transfer family protein n=1 Tax=Kordiimonas sp. TaxID=1970157 RepID=UPI003A9144E9